MSRTTIPLPEDLKNQLKNRAYDEKLSMGKFIVKALEEYLDLTKKTSLWNFFKAQAGAKKVNLHNFFEEVFEYYNKNHWKSTQKITYMKKVKDFVENSPKNTFTTKDIYKALQVTTRRQKKTIVECLRILVNKNIIKRIGKEAGEYLIIKREA